MIREERPADAAEIDRLHRLAFGREEEAEIVRALRGSVDCISLVADAGEIVGHILFTPVTVENRSFAVAPMGLAPMAVLPARQRAGIGGQLIRSGLARCREARVPFVVVLGHATYYPRFGFVPASRFGLRCPWPVGDDVFMAQELTPGALAGVSGLVRYAPELSPGN